MGPATCWLYCARRTRTVTSSVVTPPWVAARHPGCEESEWIAGERIRARLARIHQGANRAACSEPLGDEPLSRGQALLVRAWMRARRCTYPPRSAIWPKVSTIAFARIRAV